MVNCRVTQHTLAEGSVTFCDGLIHYALREFPEMGWAPGGARRILESIEANDRIELLLWSGTRVVGCCILVPDDDAHVGPCLSAQWHYVLPEFRGCASLMRHTGTIAKRLGFHIIAYTRCVGPGEYRIKYRRLYGKESQEPGQEGGQGGQPRAGRGR